MVGMIRCNLVLDFRKPSEIIATGEGEVYMAFIPRKGEHLSHASGLYVVEEVVYPTIPASAIEAAAKAPPKPVVIQVKKL